MNLKGLMALGAGMQAGANVLGGLNEDSEKRRELDYQAFTLGRQLWNETYSATDDANQANATATQGVQRFMGQHFDPAKHSVNIQITPKNEFVAQTARGLKYKMNLNEAGKYPDIMERLVLGDAGDKEDELIKQGRELKFITPIERTPKESKPLEWKSVGTGDVTFAIDPVTGQPTGQKITGPPKVDKPRRYVVDNNLVDDSGNIIKTVPKTLSPQQQIDSAESKRAYYKSMHDQFQDWFKATQGDGVTTDDERRKAKADQDEWGRLANEANNEVNALKKKYSNPENPQPAKQGGSVGKPKQLQGKPGSTTKNTKTGPQITGQQAAALAKSIGEGNQQQVKINGVLYNVGVIGGQPQILGKVN